MLPDDPRHASTAGYRAGCRCDDCRAANTRYDKLRRLDALRGKARAIPSIGTRRRIEALQWMGYTLQHIADEAGWKSEQAVFRLTTRDWLESRTADRISDVYERLCMTIGPSIRARSRACTKGYLPPLAWTNIDDPNERPRKHIANDENPEDRVDHAIVWLVINRRPRPRRLTRAETEEVIELLSAKGVTPNEMERHYGVNIWRSSRRGKAAENAA